jgi:hypothetical protein
MAMTENTNFSKGVRRMLGLSLDGWNNVMLWCLAFVAIAAISVGVAQYVIIQLAKQEAADAKAEFDKYKLTVEGKVADAKKEGIEAGKAAGNALVRAAELEKEAADARLETERLKQVVAWRSISPEGASKLEKVLAVKPGSVNLRFTDGDPEALFLAIQISRILSKANWKIGMGASKLPNGILFGIAIPDATGDDIQTLREAFSSAKIQFSTDAIPQGIELLTTTIAGAPMLHVGSRAPPQLP